jgi:hypothetical protein
MISRAYDAFVNLATQDGTLHDRNTTFMLAAGALICLLSIYLVYNVAAMAVNGAKRTYRAGRWLLTTAARRSGPATSNSAL